MTAVISPPRTRLLQKIGIVLAALLALGSLPTALQIGFDGSGWNPVVVIIAVLTLGIAIATLVLAPFAWRGGRRSAITIIVLLAVSILPALPAFFLPSNEVPVWGVLVASVGTVLTVVAIVLVASGLRVRS